MVKSFETMKTSTTRKDSLSRKLGELEKSGIQADRKHLKRNMHTQFTDPYEFARELAVNSYDALATELYISGIEKEYHAYCRKIVYHVRFK